jgi:hypothetical protein
VLEGPLFTLASGPYVRCSADLDRRAAAVNRGRKNRGARQSPRPRIARRVSPNAAVEKDGDKSRMNCAEVAISSTEKFKFPPFYCSDESDSLPIFLSASESTGERQDVCKARLKA